MYVLSARRRQTAETLVEEKSELLVFNQANVRGIIPSGRNILVPQTRVHMFLELNQTRSIGVKVAWAKRAKPVTSKQREKNGERKRHGRQIHRAACMRSSNDAFTHPYERLVCRPRRGVLLLPPRRRRKFQVASFVSHLNSFGKCFFSRMKQGEGLVLV